MAGLRAQLKGHNTPTTSRIWPAAALSIMLGIAPALAMQGEGVDAPSAPTEPGPSGSWAVYPAPSYERASALRREVLRQVPRYHAPALRSYTNRVAGRVIAASGWKPPIADPVVLIDDPAPAAISVPPGLILLNRGLLTYLQSEAELAAVIAIEVNHLRLGHPHRRRSDGSRVTELSRFLETLRELPFKIVGARAVPPGADEAQQRLRAARAGYAPELALQAALAAVGVMKRAGYAPAALVEALSGIRSAEERFEQRFGLAVALDGSSAARALYGRDALQGAIKRALQPPAPRETNPIKTLLERAAGRGLPRTIPTPEPPLGVPLGEINREGYLAQLEGTVVGSAAGEGVVRAGRFLHPGLGVGLSFPEDWNIINLPDRVLGLQPEGRAMLQVTVMERPGDGRLDHALARHLGVRDIGGELRYDADRAFFETTMRTATPFGDRRARFIVAEHGRYAFAMGLVTRSEADLEGHVPVLQRLVDSLAPLGERERAAAVPLRITVLRVAGEHSYHDLAKAQGLSPHLAEEVAALNGADPGRRPPPGSLVKMLH